MFPKSHEVILARELCPLEIQPLICYKGTRTGAALATAGQLIKLKSQQFEGKADPSSPMPLALKCGSRMWISTIIPLQQVI